MEATAKVTLDASGYEAGTQKISRADRDMAKTAKESYSQAGGAADRAFSSISTGADKVSRSYRDLKESAQQAGKVIEAESKRMIASAKAAADASERASGGHGVYGSRVRGQIGMHVATSFTDSVLAGQSPLRALTMEGPRLGELAGVGIGSTIAIGTTLAAVGKLVAAYHEAKVAKDDFDKASTFINGSGTTAENYRAQIETVTKARDEFREKTGGFVSNFAESYLAALKGQFAHPADTLGRIVTGRSFNTPEQSGRERDEAAKSRQLVDAQARLVAYLSQENDIRDVGVRYGEAAAKVADIRLEKEKAIKEARDRASKVAELSPDGEVAQIERAAKIREDAVTREETARRASISLEDSLLAIKQRGHEVDVQSAQARLAAARATLASGPDAGSGYASNAAKVHSAEEELRVASRASAERREEFATRTAIAALTERADGRHLMALSLEEQKLKSRLASPAYGADEKVGFSMSLMDNQDEQRDIFRQRVERADKGWLAQRAATYGRGYPGQRQGLVDQQTILQGQMERNTAGTDGSGQTVFKDANLGAEQIAQAAQFKRALEDVDNERQRIVQSGEQAVKVAQLEASGMTNAATAARENFGWNDRITTALQNQDTILAGQFTKLRDIASAHRALDAYLHPEKNAADRANKAAYNRAESNMEQHGGLLNVVRGPDGEVIGGTDPVTGKSVVRPGSRRMSTPNERAAASAKERDRQEHVYDKEDGSAIHDDPSNLLDFENYFGSGDDRRGWMDDDLKGRGGRVRATAGSYGRIPLSPRDALDAGMGENTRRSAARYNPFPRPRDEDDKIVHPYKVPWEREPTPSEVPRPTVAQQQTVKLDDGGLMQKLDTMATKLDGLFAKIGVA